MHRAMRTENDGRVSLFECLYCHWRVEIDHWSGGFKLLDAGDASVKHFGSTGPGDLTVDPPRL